MGQLKLIGAGGPANMWGLNIIGRLPEMKAKSEYIIVATNYGTRFCITLAVKTATAKALKQFADEIIHQFGIPRQLITDQGSAMTS